DSDPILRFEEVTPNEKSAIPARSKPVSVIKDDWRKQAAAAVAAARKKVKVRRARPVPPNATWLKYRREPWRRGYVSVFGHGKRWSGYLVGPGGEILPTARKSLSAALASWRTGKQILIDERLIELVADVS